MKWLGELLLAVFIGSILFYLVICAWTPQWFEWVDEQVFETQSTYTYNKIVYKITIDSSKTDSLRNWRK